MRPPKEAMDPEDVLLFADLEEGEKPSISESSNSWLRFMEYGDSSVLAKQDVVGARMAGKHVPEESKVSSTKEERIEDSFKLLPPSRPDNPDVAVEAVWEVFPDEICACYDYGLVVKCARRHSFKAFRGRFQGGERDHGQLLSPFPSWFFAAGGWQHHIRWSP